MKTNYFKLLELVVLICLVNLNVNAQYPDWANYYNGGTTTGFAFEGSTVWTSSDFGIVATDTVTGSKQFFTKNNSPLSTNSCNTIVIDQNNKKWIATTKGVNVFDGASWTNYNSANSPLLSDLINDIAIDNSNNKWIATSQGLAKFDGTNWTIFTTANSGLGNDAVYKLAFDTANNLWMACGLNPFYLNRYDGTSWQTATYTIPAPASNIMITGLSVGPSGKVYVSASYYNSVSLIYMGDISQYFNSAWSSVPINYPYDCNVSPQKYITALYVDSSENIWFGTSAYHVPGGATSCDAPGYLGMYNGTTTIVYPYSPAQGLGERNVKAIKFDAAGNCWVGNTKSVFQKYNSINWTNYSSSNSNLSSNVIYDFKIDNSNNKWMVIPFDQVYKFDNVNWYDENDLDSCYENITCCTAFDTNDVGYFGSLSSLMIKTFDGVTCAQTNINSTGWSGHTHLMESDSLGRIFVGTSGNGVYMYDGAWHNYSTYTSLLPTNEIEAVFTDANNNIWIGMNGSWPGGGGLAKHNGSTWSYYNTPVLPYYTVTCGAQDLNGNMWIGTGFGYTWGSPHGGGLVIYDGLNWNVYDTANSIMPSNNILSVARDLNGDMWIGTNKGLVKYDGTSWQLFTTDNSGLFSNLVARIRIDKWGNKWFLTDAGLAVFRQGGVVLSDDEYSLSNNESSFYSYPNPVSNIMEIKFINKDFSINDLSIFNLLGEKVMSIPIEKDLDKDVSYKINLANLNNGVYFLRLYSSNSVITKKIVVSH